MITQRDSLELFHVCNQNIGRVFSYIFTVSNYKDQYKTAQQVYSVFGGKKACGFVEKLYEQCGIWSSDMCRNASQALNVFLFA